MKRTVDRRSGCRMAKHESRAFYLFILPWLIGFFCLTLGPMLYSLYASFSEWNGIGMPLFNGFENLKTMLFEDDKFWTSILNTFYFAFFSVPINLFVALLLAILLNKPYKGHTLFRSVFYLPSVVASVAVYIVWTNLFNPDVGYLNYVLSLLGIKGPAWLNDPHWAMPSIILMTVTFCGGSMLIFLAGLQDIPEALYEAARMDGARPLQLFWHITVPLLSPVIFYNLVMGIIGGLQVFAQPFIMTAGGPMNSTYVFGLHLYNNAFRYYKFGYACSLAWFMFMVILLLSLLVFRSSKHWVHTDNEGE